MATSPYGAINMVALNAARSSQLLRVHTSHYGLIIEWELNFIIYPGLQIFLQKKRVHAMVSYTVIRFFHSSVHTIALCVRP